MTVARASYRGELAFECDCCSEVEDTGSRDFHTALSFIKELGWVVVKDRVSNEWEHYCGLECQRAVVKVKQQNAQEDFK